MDQSTHIVRKAKWLSVIEQCQKRPIDMTVRLWLADNGVSEKSYYTGLENFVKKFSKRHSYLPFVKTAKYLLLR